MSRPGGHAVVEQLIAEGVGHVFTVPGESFLSVLDGLHDPASQGRIRVVTARHENGAAFMAEAVGQLTGRPAVCVATRAVGAANLAIGIHTALQDSTPMLALVGQVPRRWLGREALQEVDQVATFGALAKWAIEVDDADRLPDAISEALAVARSDRPGPVLVALPEDMLTDTTSSPVRASVAASPVSPSRDEVETVLRLLRTATRPVIVAGAGVLRARGTDALVRLAELLEVPVMAVWRRPDVFPNDHRLFLGTTGIGAPPSVLERLRSADVMVAIGTRLSQVASYGYSVPSPATRFAHVDVAPSEPPWRPGLTVRADAAEFLASAIRVAEAGAGEEADAIREGVRLRMTRNDADRAAWLQQTEPTEWPPTGAGVHPGNAVRVLSQRIPGHAILTADAGNFGGWTGRYMRVRPPGRYLGPASGAMGYALPAAIAAALVSPQAPVVAMAGDGGFGMAMVELETAVRERARVLSIVFDNRMYGTIRAHQERAAPGRVVGTSLGPVDFAAIARGFGASAWTVDDDAQLPDALDAALAADGPTLVHLRTDPSILGVDGAALSPDAR